MLGPKEIDQDLHERAQYIKLFRVVSRFQKEAEVTLEEHYLKQEDNLLGERGHRFAFGGGRRGPVVGSQSKCP